MSLNGKKILIGVTGSIAAYKSAFLVRLFVKNGAEVKVVMSESAEDFITPLTLSTLSKNTVYDAFFNRETGNWNNHVDLGLWADIVIIAPATANTLSKMANGLCDNLLLGVYLSAKCPVFIAPAMDLDMYKNPAVQKSIDFLIKSGVKILEAESGELASGLYGQGRMAEPENIYDEILAFLKPQTKLTGKQILLTLGPTKEALDPVRFISNHSSGKMGFEIAQNLAQKGAIVTVISGVKNLNAAGLDIKIIPVNSADDMYEACKKLFSKVDIAVFTAAVADYKPKFISDTKIKKKEDTFTIELVKNVDIAAEFGKIKKAKQLSVGFALETNNELENAADKLKRKNFDMVVLNSMNDSGATFGYDTNKVTIIKSNEEPLKYELKPKNEVANDIVEQILTLL
jgi:phosphopantothenoylcysteine decarboxylase/phosphopantothenate--cysteine ligase